MTILSSKIAFSAYSRNVYATALSALIVWYFLTVTDVPRYNQVEPRTRSAQNISVASSTPTATATSPLVFASPAEFVLAFFAGAAIHHIIFRVQTSQPLLAHPAFRPWNSSRRAISLCRGRLTMLAISALSKTSRSPRFPSISTDTINFVSRVASGIVLLAWDSGIVILAVSTALDQSSQMIYGTILSLYQFVFSCPPTPDHAQAMLDALKKLPRLRGAPIPDPRHPFTRHCTEALRDALKKSAPDFDPPSFLNCEYLEALLDIIKKLPLRTQSAPIPDNRCFSRSYLGLWLSTEFASLRSTVIGAFTSAYSAAYEFIFTSPTTCFKNFYCPVPIAKPSLLSIICDRSIRFVKIAYEILLSLGPLYSTVKGEITLAYSAAYDSIFPAHTTCFKNFYCPVPIAKPSPLSIIWDQSFRFVEIVYESLSLRSLCSTVIGEFHSAYSTAYNLIFPTPPTCYKNFYCPIPFERPSPLSIFCNRVFRFVSRPLLSVYRSVFPPSLPQEYIRASSMPAFDRHRWFKFFVNRAMWAFIYWLGYLCVVGLAELCLLLVCIVRALCGITEFPEYYDEDSNPRFDRDA